jgi:chaperone required for assembly of F1-ATPase
MYGTAKLVASSKTDALVPVNLAFLEWVVSVVGVFILSVVLTVLVVCSLGF